MTGVHKSAIGSCNLEQVLDSEVKQRKMAKFLNKSLKKIEKIFFEKMKSHESS